MNRKKWNVLTYDKARASALSERTGLDPFTSLLLLSRGCDTGEKMLDFVNAATAPLSDPFALKDMDKAVARVREALERDESILVYGDYDCDGVTATALLYSYLLTLTDRVDYYIPSRMTDGYGLSDATAARIVEGDVDLVITVDNGIASVAEAAYFAENGVDLIVTDHHIPGPVLPDCCAVVDPHREDDDSPCKDLAGVGVAMKLCAALEDGDYETVLRDAGDLLTIGTIADIVPLVGENRTLVTQGLPLIERTDRPGLSLLLEKLSLRGKKLTSSSVAFGVAPKINAAGRMGTADAAIELLLTDDFDRAQELVDDILSSNAARVKEEARIIEEASEEIRTRSLARERVLVVAGRDWHPGVIGIVAARLTDRYGVPACVITTEADGVCRGSARSVEGFSIYDALSAVGDLLLRFGGHAGAAGFALEEKNLDAFRQAINAYAAGRDPVFPTLDIECRLVPRHLDASVLESLSLLEPFGAGNPAPVFGLFGMTITSVSGLSQNKHTKLGLTKDGVNLTAPYFGVSPENFDYQVGDTVDLAVTLERNEFRGSVSVSVYVRSVRPAGTDDESLFSAIGKFRRLELGDPLSEEEKAALLPDRKLFEEVFSYLRASSGYRLPERAAWEMGRSPEEFGRVLTAFSALGEIGVLTQSEGRFAVAGGGKKSLGDSLLLQRLQKKEGANDA